MGIYEEKKTLYDEFVRNIAIRDGCYKGSLPWKELHESLVDNYLLSTKD